MDDKRVNEDKLWESAYSFLNHPRMGPYIHGAGMVERTTGVTHYWLVRGPCNRSVVQELQSQLGQAYSFARPEVGPPEAPPAMPAPQPRAKDRPTDRLFALLLVVGLLGVVLGSVAWA